MFSGKYMSIITVLSVVMLISCENSITTVQEITRTDTAATVSGYNIEYIRTDSARQQVLLKSPVLHRYTGKDGYQEFPEGFEVYFYDILGNQKSYIRANYGITYEKRKLMQARNDVVVKNFETQEQLNTENLVWDQRKKIIWANKFVKVTSPDKIVFGDSLIADESFRQHEILNINAIIEVEEDTLVR